MAGRSISYGRDKDTVFNSQEFTDSPEIEGVLRWIGDEPTLPWFESVAEQAAEELAPYRNFLADLGVEEYLINYAQGFLEGKGKRARASINSGRTMVNLQNHFDQLPLGNEQVPIGFGMVLTVDDGSKFPHTQKESVEVHCVVDMVSTDEEIYQRLDLIHPGGGAHELENQFLRTSILVIGGDPGHEVVRVSVFDLLIRMGFTVDELQYIKNFDYLDSDAFNELQKLVVNEIWDAVENQRTPEPKNSIASA